MYASANIFFRQEQSVYLFFRKPESTVFGNTLYKVVFFALQLYVCGGGVGMNTQSFV